MSRTKGKVPAYTLHRASGRAVVRVQGRDHYLGRYGSPESHELYARKLAEWRADQAQRLVLQSQDSKNSEQLSVAEVVLRFREFARNYYARDGKPTKEFTNFKYALRPLRLLYGTSLAREFGPLALKAVRQKMIDLGHSRRVINHNVNRIKRFFKWAVSEELVPPHVYEAIRTVSGLRLGRTSARELEPVKPVLDEVVDATVPFMSKQVAAMVQLQRLTGMRPCEVVLMRPCDLVREGPVWIYEPHDHKNRWRGHTRSVAIGPRAQQIIAEFINRPTDTYLFSPREAEAERNQTRRKNRKSPLTPSQVHRRPKPNSKRAKRERYDVDSYRRAITYSIKLANRQREDMNKLPHWFPLQLRHTCATEIRKSFGIEAAQVTLGHTRADVTQVYAERNLQLAIQIAAKTG